MSKGYSLTTEGKSTRSDKKVRRGRHLDLQGE